MKYMLLLYSDPEAGQAEMDEWFAYTQALATAGVLLGGDALHGIDQATTLRVRDGARLTSDGPFAETKEILGGYYLIDVADLDAALDWAAMVPLAPFGSVEVRPLVGHDAPSS
jgi:hypothetical protein